MAEEDRRERIPKKSCAERGERIGNTSEREVAASRVLERIARGGEEGGGGESEGEREIYKPVSSRIKLVPQRVDVQRAGKEGEGANRTLMSAFNL